LKWTDRFFEKSNCAKLPATPESPGETLFVDHDENDWLDQGWMIGIMPTFATIERINTSSNLPRNTICNALSNFPHLVSPFDPAIILFITLLAR
jgi:hypothetical protein